MSLKKRGLGRGLDSLLSSVNAVAAPVEAGEELRQLALDECQPGKHQPRRAFDNEALEELAGSIKAQGVIQPIVVRPADNGRYEIVAGERRWRAAKLAGLATIPAVVRNLDERGAMAVALVENIQRADLNPLEEAEALHKLILECGLTHEQAATAVGRKRASITNLLRVMELEAEVQQWLRENRLTLGHAKALLGLPKSSQTALAHRVIDEHLTVRQTEALVQAAQNRGEVKQPAKTAPPATELETRIRETIGLPVKLSQNQAGRGKLTVVFRNAKELEALLGRIASR
ncbi:ParB/RepB/Spo0J family partition protein [Hydrocarboniphaga sp.]|uniref:ParB/RepB/Spo0J family partition protein n=1 Tax=Hydrocarboniphaga sp. TaxID=2033016 RepID=UPI003D11C1C8